MKAPNGPVMVPSRALGNSQRDEFVALLDSLSVDQLHKLRDGVRALVQGDAGATEDLTEGRGA